MEKSRRIDIHNYAKRLELAYKKIKSEKLNVKDRRLIREFAGYLSANGLTNGRVAKAVFQLSVLRRHMDCDFAKADGNHMQKVLTWINHESSYKPWNMSDSKGRVKRFYKWVNYDMTSKDKLFPPLVAWISTNVKKSEL